MKDVDEKLTADLSQETDQSVHNKASYMGVERRLYGCRAPVIWMQSASYIVERQLYGCRVPVIWM